MSTKGRRTSKATTTTKPKPSYGGNVYQTNKSGFTRNKGEGRFTVKKKRFNNNANEDVSHPKLLPSSTTNPNIQRCLSQVIECNGIKANNNLKLFEYSECGNHKSINSVMVPKNFSTASAIDGRVPPNFRSTAKEMVNYLVVALKETLQTECIDTNCTVLGEVAWLSHPEILASLAKCKRVLIVVNREDYTTWGSGKCLQYYNQLPRFDEPLNIAFGHLDTILNTLEPGRKSGMSSYAPVRAYGTANSLEHNKVLIFFQKRFISYRMLLDENHKLRRFANLPGLYFMIQKKLGKNQLELDDGAWFEFPHAYWTGSMNFTKKSEYHHESAELIRDDNLAWNKFMDFSATFFNSTSVASTANNATPAKRNMSKN